MRKFVLTEREDGSWSIEESDGSSVWPTTTKKTKREMAARLLQLLDLGPVAPQTEPERVCVGGYP